MKSFSKTLLLLIVITASTSAHSQNTNYAGLSFTSEIADNLGFRPGFGAFFERQVTKRSGIQTGFYYRTYMQEILIFFNSPSGSQTFVVSISEKHLSVPVLYKFYSRIVNFQAGLTFDFFLGWEEKNKVNGGTINSYEINPNMLMGFLAKLSKTIRLSDQFLLEPEIRFNPIFSHNRAYAGFAIAGKYQLIPKK